MNLFEQAFKKTIAFERPLNEENEPVNVPPGTDRPVQPSDSEVWGSQNPGIKEKGLEGKFDVEGIPQEVRDQYTTKIDSWREQINTMSDTLEQIYDFATKTAEKAGADKIFAETSDTVEQLLTDIGTLQGKLKFLAKKVMVAIDRDNKKQRGL